MAYRRNGKDAEVRWLKRNRERLINAGLPAFVIHDLRKWNYVLLHGDDELESGWHSCELTSEQSRELLGILREFYQNEIGLNLMEQLRRKLGAGNTP